MERGSTRFKSVLTEVLSDANNGFPYPPPDKYYLCDAAYTNTRGFMLPHRNVRYWLGDFRRQRAVTKEQKFNHAYTKLRNVIERVYGVLKARFPILKQVAPYSIDAQRDIVIACFAIHNFIRKENINDDIFNEYDQADIVFNTENENQAEEENENQVERQPWGTEDVQFMNNLRQEITNQFENHV